MLVYPYYGVCEPASEECRDEHRQHHDYHRNEQELPLENRHRAADRFHIAADEYERVRVVLVADIGAHGEDCVVLALIAELLVIYARVRIQRRLTILRLVKLVHGLASTEVIHHATVIRRSQLDVHFVLPRNSGDSRVKIVAVIVADSPACLYIRHCFRDLVGFHPLIEHREHSNQEHICENEHCNDYRFKAHPDVEFNAPEEFHQLASNL